MKADIMEWADLKNKHLPKKKRPSRLESVVKVISNEKDLNPYAKLAYIHMAMGSDSFSPSIQTLEKRLGTTRKTAIKALRDLDGKYIYLSHCDIETRRNIYTLLPPDKWGSVESLPDHYQWRISTGGSGESPPEVVENLYNNLSNNLSNKPIKDIAPKKKKKKTTKKTEPKVKVWDPDHRYALLFKRLNEIDWFQKSFCAKVAEIAFDSSVAQAKISNWDLIPADFLFIIDKWAGDLHEKPNLRARPLPSFKSYVAHFLPWHIDPGKYVPIKHRKKNQTSKDVQGSRIRHDW